MLVKLTVFDLRRLPACEGWFHLPESQFLELCNEVISSNILPEFMRLDILEDLPVMITAR
jgi:hypothetical protein